MRIAVAPARCLVLLVVACASFCSTGCTLIGLGVGATVSRGEYDVPLDKLKSYKAEGKPLDVDVYLRPGAAAGQKPLRVIGRWDGQTEKELVVLTDEGFGRWRVVRSRTIPLEDVQRVDVGVGAYWAGALAWVPRST